MNTIKIDTFRALLERQYELACWCGGCRRWASVDLAMLVRNGLGDRSIIGCKARCRLCGSEGDWQVRPPIPPRNRKPRGISAAGGPISE